VAVTLGTLAAGDLLPRPSRDTPSRASARRLTPPTSTRWSQATAST
jgi:hypothetical protein